MGSNNITFTVEERAGINVIVFDGGGCRPAHISEVKMYKEIDRLKADVERKAEALVCARGSLYYINSKENSPVISNIIDIINSALEKNDEVSK